jgi:hypothetical protein
LRLAAVRVDALLQDQVLVGIEPHWPNPQQIADTLAGRRKYYARSVGIDSEIT